MRSKTSDARIGEPLTVATVWLPESGLFWAEVKLAGRRLESSNAGEPVSASAVCTGDSSAASSEAEELLKDIRGGGGPITGLSTLGLFSESQPASAKMVRREICTPRMGHLPKEMGFSHQE